MATIPNADIKAFFAAHGVDSYVIAYDTGNGYAIFMDAHFDEALLLLHSAHVSLEAGVRAQLRRRRAASIEAPEGTFDADADA